MFHIKSEQECCSWCIASSCLLVGVASGFGAARLAQDAAENSYPVASSSMQHSAKANEKVMGINSPFSLTATSAMIEERVQSVDIPAKPPQAHTPGIGSASDYINTIDYTKLSDYNQLLRTLS